MSSKSTFGLYFYLNTSRPNQQGECPVNLRITIQGSTTTFSIKRAIPRSMWNSSTGAAKGNSKEAVLLNQYISAIRVKAYQKHTELSFGHEVVTAEMLRDDILGVTPHQTVTLMELWTQHNTELKELLGRDATYANFQKYTTCMNYVREFLEKEYKKSDVLINRVDRHMVTRFEHYLKSEKGIGYNTTMKYLQNFKKIVRRALNNGWIKQDPFVHIKLSLKEVERPYLTEEELSRVIAKDISMPRLRQVRDMFVFSCYTGLAYIDIKQLRREEIETSPNGVIWIRTRRQKTRVRSNIPLLMPALDILSAYSDLDQLSPKDPVLPIISNQKMNAYLKEIADICGIEKLLSFHIARHTFATTVTLMNGVPIESVSKMLGHKDLKTTQHYARIVDAKVGQDMELLATRLQARQTLRKVE